MKNTGVTIFDLNTYKPIHITSIETSDKDTHGKRLYQIGKEIIRLKDTYPPGVIAIERGFSRFNTSTQVIYRVHGLMNYLFHDIDQVYYPPKKIKETIIRGDATKKLVRQMIEKKYSKVKFANEDESDAFAIGLTWLILNKKIKWAKGKWIEITKYKLFGIEVGETFYVGHMSLDSYLWYLNLRRHFNKELTIEYTKEIYNIDLTNIISEYDVFWDFKENLYETFDYEILEKDNGSRDYFTKHGRKRYIKFMKHSYFNDRDCLSNFFWYKDIHHVYPLIFGGNSDLSNLIHISKFNHDLLHENPLEQDRIKYFQALDYLGHLYSSQKVNELIKKYKIYQFNDNMAHEVFKAGIKEETHQFYKKLMS